MTRALGLDVGDRRIGVALADELGLTAQPLATLVWEGRARDLERLSGLCREHGVGVIVVGLPLNMDGTEGPRTAVTRQFADALGEKTGLSIAYCDERLTTVQAERVLLEANVSRKKRRQVIDTMAAQVILQGWLDARAFRQQDPEEEL